MYWQDNDPGYLVTDFGGSDREKSIDNFLAEVFEKIGEAYDYKSCPAIIFDLRESTNLQVYDSPDGFDICGNEKLFVSFSQQSFDFYWRGYIRGVIDCAGDTSVEYHEATNRVVQLTWSALKSCIKNGKAKSLLKKFNHEPAVIYIYEGNDRIAHDLVTGNRVEMHGKPIEPESKEHCQCRFCKS